MKQSSISITTALALLALVGAPILAHGQTAGQDPHHPRTGTEATPAPEPGPSQAQPSTGPAVQQGQQSQGMTGGGMGMMSPEMMQMMQRMMMGQQQGRMGPGMMGGGMGHGGMRMTFALVDADGDGALSVEEMQEAHGRIFKHVDADKDGRVTLEELQAFLRGTATQAQQMPMGQGMRMGGAQSESSRGYTAAMQKMMDGMASMQTTGDPAKDFAMMMIPHHQSAIDMAQVYLQHGDDPELTELAKAIISEQQKEIEFLKNRLGKQR